MFKLRQDLYERREKADRLKLAFASAAIAGIGASVSFACLGEVGASIYGISLLASISAAIEIQTQMDNSDEEERRSSPEVKKLAERLAKKFSLATPDVYISREIKTYEAGTDGKIIEMGLDYEACSNHIQAQIVIGHELGHIYHKDCLKRLLLASFKLSTLSVLGATAIELFFVRRTCLMDSQQQWWHWESLCNKGFTFGLAVFANIGPTGLNSNTRTTPLSLPNGFRKLNWVCRWVSRKTQQKYG